MAAPFVATYRLKWQYQVSGLTHTAHVFIPLPTGTIGALSIPHSDLTSGTLQAAVNRLATAWSALQVGGSTLGDFSVEKRVSGAWNLLDTYTPTYTNAASGTGTSATQATLVLRDADYFPVKVEFLEGNFGIPLHYVSVTSMPSGPLSTFTEAFTHFAANADDPYHWLIGRSGSYLRGSGEFVGMTTTLNRRVRRDRSLA